MKQITYAVSKDDGLVYSRVGSEIAIPVLQFDRIGRNGDFTQPLEYELEKCRVLELADYWPRLRWTKKIPVRTKNLHRQFWGMRPLPGPAA
jgi:hypothetical protein